MLNGHLTRRRGGVLAAMLAALAGVALLLAYAGVPLAEAQSPPATPSSVTLTRADGTVTASWPAVSGATKYHVTYSTDGGGSWHAPVSDNTNISTNSLTFNANNAKSYVVGVRAGNGSGQWSGWRNSAPAGPYTPDPTPTPAPNPPATPSSVTVTRADGTVTASWPAIAGSTKYHVTYSSDNKQSWTAASDSHTSNSITISGADNASRTSWRCGPATPQAGAAGATPRPPAPTSRPRTRRRR